jgi:hypothetical protein
MSRFKVLKPTKTRNVAPNPSFEKWIGNFNSVERYPAGWTGIGTTISIPLNNVYEPQPGYGTRVETDVYQGGSSCLILGNVQGWGGIIMQNTFDDSTYINAALSGGLTVSLYVKAYGAITTERGRC